MAIDITGFFNNLIPLQNNDVISTFSPGYVRSNVDVLFQKVTRIDAVKKSSLMDYNYLETNSNFSKSGIQPQMEKVVSQLGASTQLVQLVKTQLMVSGIIEYLPTGFKDVLLNYQAFMDTNVNFLSTFQQDTTFKTLAAGIGADLISQYAQGNIYLQTLLQISNKVADYYTFGAPTPNNAIREVLSLGLQSFLPDSMTGFIDLLQYADLMEQSFDSDAEINAFNSAFETLIGNTGAQPVANFTPDTTPYTTNNITLSDPLGFAISTQLTNEVITSYTTTVSNFISGYGLPDDVVPELLTLVIDDFTTNLNAGMQYKSLPQAASVIAGTQGEVFNRMGDSIKNMINDVADVIFTDFGIVDPNNGGSKVDRLYNLHKSIKSRFELYDRNGSFDQFAQLDAYLAQYFPNGISREQLEVIYNRLENFASG